MISYYAYAKHAPNRIFAEKKHWKQGPNNNKN